MPIAYTSFTSSFPTFSDGTKFPQPQVEFWLNFAYGQFDAKRWGTALDMGVMLYVAHNLLLEQQNANGSGGAAPGMLNNEAVGPVSAGYDTTSTAIQGAANYNSTSYGQRFYRLARTRLSGPLYVPSCRPRMSF